MSQQLDKMKIKVKIKTKIKIMPALDLLQGKVVRLKQGSFDEISYYEGSLVDLALRYEQSGAEYLHLVDLDGAKLRRPVQAPAIVALAQQTSLKLQVGGGIRSKQDLDMYLDSGIDRIVIGSLAIQDPEATLALIRAVGAGRITLAFDFKRLPSGHLAPAVDAWSKVETSSPELLFANYQKFTDLEYLCTDISRDGCLSGIDGSFYKTLKECSNGAKIIVSGGVAELDDLRLARELGMHGAVLGKALHEDRIDLKEALQC